MIASRRSIACADGMAARRLKSACLLVAALAILPCAAPARAADKAAPSPAPAQEPLITVELPHPALLVDRLTDPRIQQSLRLLPPYRNFLEGPQFRQLQAVVNLVSAQLGTTWDRAVRDLAGGGLVVRVLADKGTEPRVQAVITARDPKVLSRVNEIFLNMARQDAKTKKMPDPVRTSDYKGTVIHVLGGEKDRKLGYAIVSGHLALASSIRDLEPLIERLRADEKKLAGPGSTTPDDASLLLRGHVDLQRLKALDPRKYTLPDRTNPGLALFFGSWYEALKRARAIDATLRWSDSQLAVGLDLPLPKDARPASIKGFLPGPGEGPAPPLRPPGTIASLSLWRDWATIWESRADLLPPEAVQGLAQLDTLAGQFFQAREFGDLLAAFDPHWRLVVAQQDYASMKPAPDQKLPAFAIVAELNGSQDDFAARLKIAFQTIVAISNVEAAQKKNAVLELGSEELDGVTIATTKYVVSKNAPSATEPGATRYNFSPSTAHVGRYFILSTNVGLARSLVKELKAAEKAGRPAKDAPATFTVEADGTELSRLFEQNRSRMVMQNMLGRGETRAAAEDRVARIVAFFRYLGHGRLAITDDPDRTRLDLKLDLSR